MKIISFVNDVRFLIFKLLLPRISVYTPCLAPLYVQESVNCVFVIAIAWKHWTDTSDQIQ